MKVNRLSLTNVAPFKQLDLDFTADGGKMIAICGPNGSGKTTLLECLLIVPLHGKFPWSGELPQDKFFGDGGTYFCDWGMRGNDYQTMICGKPGKTPEYVLRKNGEYLAGPNQKDYMAAIRTIYPHSLDVTCAASYATQGDVGGILRMQPQKRGQVLGVLLGLDEYDSIYADILKRINELEKSPNMLVDPGQPITDDMIARHNECLAHLETEIEYLEEGMQAAKDASATLLQNLPQDYSHDKQTDREIALLAQLESIRDALGGIWLSAESAYGRYVNTKKQIIRDMDENISLQGKYKTIDFSNPMCQSCVLTTGHDDLIRIYNGLCDNLSINRHTYDTEIEKLTELSTLAQEDFRKVADEVQYLKSIRDASLLDARENLTVKFIDTMDLLDKISLKRMEHERHVIELKNLKATRARQMELAIEVGKQKQKISDLMALGSFVKLAKSDHIMSLIPKISATTNDLLSIFPNHMELRFAPVKTLADGSTRTEFTPMIYVDGMLRKNPSGGELSIAGECLRTAICAVMSESLDDFSTIGRDETTGSLDEVNTGVYIQMLRKILDRNKVDRVFVVAHNMIPETADMIIKTNEYSCFEIL